MTRRSLLPLILLTLALFSCSRRPGDSPSGKGRNGAEAPDPKNGAADSVSEGGTASGWYYFSKNGIHPAPSPAAIPPAGFVPWTEATRVVDMTDIQGKPAFLVNRLGIMVGGTGSSLYRLPEAYASSTLGGFVRENGNTGIRSYRNTTFSGSSEAFTGPFLLRFFPETGRFDPWAYPRDLGANPDAVCVALDRIGPMWYASFKSERDSRVEFLYLEFERLPPGDTGGEGPASRGITADSWRSAVRPFSFEELPEPLARLFSAVPSTAALSVRARVAGSPTAQTWAREGEGEPLEAEAFASDSGAAALFSDGTFVIRTETASRAFRLPRLSAGYSYGCFMIAGSTLIAAWEERRFFETGRAGLLEIPLPDGIYWQ